MTNSTISKNFQNGMPSQDAKTEGGHVLNAAMNYWFVRNQGLQRKAWPSTYQPTHQYQSMQAPVGAGDKFWDPLINAEKRWISEPIKSQFGDEIDRFWSQSGTHKTVERLPVKENNLSRDEILSAISPFDELGNVCAPKAVQSLTAIMANADMDSISNHVCLSKPNPKWKLAIDW